VESSREGYGAGTLFPLQGAVVSVCRHPRGERGRLQAIHALLSPSGTGQCSYVAAVRAAAAQIGCRATVLPQDAERAVDTAKQDSLSQLH